jgi:hypothetical protein
LQPEHRAIPSPAKRVSVHPLALGLLGIAGGFSRSTTGASSSSAATTRARDEQKALDQRVLSIVPDEAMISSLALPVAVIFVLLSPRSFLVIAVQD